MVHIRNMTIKSKLTIAMMAVSTAAVVLSCIIFIFSAVFQLRRDHFRKDYILAEVTAVNVQAALMFDVPEDAEKTLSSLAADKSILYASIHTLDGELFAEYRPKGSTLDTGEPGLHLDEGYDYSDGMFRLYYPIFFEGEKIGTLYLLDDQSEIYTSLKWDVVTLFFILLIAMASSYLLASKFQGFIADPILSLARTAHVVRQTEDYSIRVEKHGDDEVSVLIESFNLMLQEIQQRENALKKSEAKFRSIVETTSDWIWEINTECIYTYASPKIEELLGYKPEDIIGKTPFEFMHPEDVGRVQKCFKRYMEDMKPFEGLENSNLHKNGRVVVLETSAVPVFDDYGNFSGYRGIDRDVTERKRSQDALESSESRFRALAQNANNAIISSDIEGTIVFWNPAAERMFGYSSQEAIGREIIMVLSERHHQEYYEDIERIRLTGKSITSGKIVEFFGKRKDGSEFPLELSLSQWNTSEGLFFTEILTDITERKRAEEKIEYLAKFPAENPGPVLRISSECKLQYANDASKPLLDDWNCNVGERVPKYWCRNTQEALKTGSSKKIELEYASKIFSFVIAPVTEAGYVNLYGRDVTERKLAEEALASSEKKFRSLAETAASAIISADSLGNMIFWNPAAERMFGYSLDEAIGQPLTLIMPQRYHKTHLKGLKRIVETGKSRIKDQPVEFFGLRKDGTEFPLELSLSNWQTGEGLFFSAILTDITERKRSEQAIKISEANYRSIFDSVSDSIFVHDIETDRFVNSNQQAAAIFEYSQDEFLNLSVQDISVVQEGFNSEQARAWLKKAYHEGPQRFEWHCKSKYGRAFWVEVSLKSVILEGKPCILSLLRDIDERKKAEDALASSEARFRALAQNANSGIVSTNSWGQIVFWNPAAEKMFGYRSEEVMNQLFSLILSQQHYEKYSNDLEQIRLTGQSSYTGKLVELNGIKKDGVEFPMEMSLSQWQTSEGLFFTAILTDITERKQSALALRLDESRLKVLVELNQMVDISQKELVDFSLEKAIELTKSKVGYIAFMNEDETILSMYSWSREAMSECMIRQKPLIYPVEKTGLWGEAVRQRKPIISNDYIDNEPLKRGYPEGHVHITRHMNIPVFEGRKIVAVAGVGNKKEPYNDSDVRQLTLLMDGMWRIIQRNKTNRERRELLRTLASKNEELESIVYTASHDLRSPLVNIDGFSSELATCCQEVTDIMTSQSLPSDIEKKVMPVLTEDIPASLGFIRASTQKMDMLMRGLLKLSRLGRAAIDIRPLDMNQLLANIKHGMQHQINACGAEVMIGDLPASLGDQSQISQVFTNLLDNSLKYLDPLRKGKIQVEGKIEGIRSVYSVKDNGLGISPDFHHKVFEIFHRLDPEGKVHGEGIGLTIVKRILDRHGGEIWVESVVGEGTTFHISLPAPKGAIKD